MNKLIYLDYAATTPVDPRVAEKLVQHLTMDDDSLGIRSAICLHFSKFFVQVVAG